MSELYSQAKVFHFADKLKDIASGIASAPIHVRLKPTNRCNHGCWYCCYRSEDLFLGERMNEADEIPPGELLGIAGDLVDMGVRAVTFSGGGEPLMHPSLVESVEVLTGGGVKVAVLTNGSLLADEAAQVLGSRATWVRVSIGGTSPESLAEASRVGIGEFDRVCANLGGFASSKSDNCELGVNLVVTRENHGGVYGFLGLMKGLGVDHVKVSEAVVGVTFEENRDYMSAFAAPVREAVAKAKEELDDDSFEVVDRLLDIDAAGDNPYDKSYTRCPFIQYLTVIAADMCVYACQDKAYTGTGLIGRIGSGGFSELWFDEDTLRRLRGLDPSRVCGHHCVAHEKNLLLFDFLDADPGHLDFV